MQLKKKTWKVFGTQTGIPLFQTGWIRHWILQRYYKLLGYFGHAWLWPAKTILSRCSKLWYLCSCKKIIFIPHLLVEILQIYLGYFGHTWVRPPKGIGPTCRKLWCLSANKNSTWFLNFLKRYYTLKNPTIWLVNNILGNNSRIRISLNMGFVIESQEIHIASFVGKTNDKIFKRKISKIPMQICSWAKVNFWQKLGSITFQHLWSSNFKYKSGKIMSQFWEKNS